MDHQPAPVPDDHDGEEGLPALGLVRDVELDSSDSEEDVADNHLNLAPVDDMIRAVRAERIPLHEFLRLLGGGIRDEDHANGHQELVDSLRRRDIIKSDEVYQAMLACDRGQFTPEPYRQDAYIDQPMKIEDLGFNISAPHMHATALEALEIKPGERVLDVGCGCGLVAACAAHMVGKQGRVMGIDIRSDAIALCKTNLVAQNERNPSYTSQACPIEWELHNVFYPTSRHVGRYDKIHVGAMCPEGRLVCLLQLLKPEGGLIIVPVNTDLRLITKKGEEVSQKVLSQVRFSLLEEVPTDAQIVKMVMEEEGGKRASVKVPPSTLHEDLPGLAPKTPSPKKRLIQHASDTAPYGDIGDAAESCGDEEDLASWLKGSEGLGSPDCWLVGDGWKLPAHKAVLRARCDLFRALSASGMRDADAGEIGVPDSFSREALQQLLEWSYSDIMSFNLDASQVVDLVRVATYYGAPRLRSLCEHRLAADLLPPVGPPHHTHTTTPAPPSPPHSPAPGSQEKESGSTQGDGGERGERDDGVGAPQRKEGGSKRGASGSSQGGTPEIAAQLLALGDECGLEQLKAAALAHITLNFDKVSTTEAYAQLPRHLVDSIAADLYRQYQHFNSVLHQLSNSQPLPPPNRSGPVW